MLKLRHIISVLSFARCKKSSGAIPVRTVSEQSSTPSFHLFSKLPVELQLHIWKLALLPQLIWLGSPKGMSLHYRGRWKPVLPVKKSPNTSLLSACYNSRQVALRIYSEDHVVSVVRDKDRPLMKPKRLFSTKFDPSRDSLYIHGLLEFGIFAHWCGINPGAVTDPQSWEKDNFVGVKRLVIGAGLLREFFEQYCPSDNNASQREEYFGLLKFGLVTGLMEFRDLEELIFVRPSWDEVSSTIRAKKKLDVEASNNRVAGEAAAWRRARIRKFAESQDAMAISSWWAKPMITMMTEQELHERFPDAM